ncbi:MAG: zinc finger domain-containing protein [Myxococcota bacterium]
MRIQAPHCPSCGAPIEVPEGAARVTCSYCSAALIIEDERVSTRRPKTPPSATEDDESPYPEPDATLWAKVYPRFELSVIEQRVPQAVPELFAGLELDAERFAFISLRVVDRDGRPQPWPLDAAFEALRASLEADGDPGLAANLALETLCARPFDHRLECAVVLFEPRHMRVTSYAAGVNAGLLWASGEEGRTIAIDGHRSALERKMLRESADHFSNGRPILLAAGDLILIPSAGFMGRGARGYSEGPRVLQEVANAQLGEEPLRVVTLAKNAFWAEFQKQRRSVNTPVGDVRIAAVRAISPPLVTALPLELSPRTFRTRRFELTALTRPGERLELAPLHSDRHVLLWLAGVEGPLADAAFSQAMTAVRAVLDGDTGDNENPRQAGRDALAAMGLAPDAVQLAVIQLFDAFERVKYFRHGWKQPLGLGPRGVRGDGMQQFDEGGEATVHEGSRLFFPGALAWEGHHADAPGLATVWRGGKASRLYEALTAHWKTRRTERALQQLALAARSDEPAAALAGLALVTGVAPP